MIISSGMSFSGIFMYSYRSSGVFKYMFEISMARNFAEGVERTLFHSNLTVSMSAVSVVTAPG